MFVYLFLYKILFVDILTIVFLILFQNAQKFPNGKSSIMKFPLKLQIFFYLFLKDLHIFY